MDIQDKVVIVTGASAGIGRATAVAAAKAGANVVLVARRENRLTDLANELETQSGKRLIIPGDIREPTFATKIVQEVKTKLGRVDVLVNNAALGHRSLLVNMSPYEMQMIWETNVMGLLYLTRACIEQMSIQGQGHIINVSSIAGQRPLPNSTLYCASKSAVNSISRSLRMECKADNIKITTIYPGLTETEFGMVRLGEKGTNRFGLKGVPPERVAKKILQAIRNGYKEVYVTWYDWFFVQLNRHFPRITDWLVSRVSHLS